MTPVFADIDLMMRGGALSLLAVWTWLLIRDQWSALSARLAVLMNLTIACYVIVTADWSGLAAGSWSALPLALGAGAAPGCFWLFAKAWFGDQHRLRRIDLLLVALSVANVALLQLTFDAKPPVFLLSVLLFRVGMFGFAAAALYAAWRGRDGDLVETRRRLRLRFVIIVGVYVILINIAEMLVRNGFAPPLLDAIVETGILLIAIGFCSVMFGHRQAELFAGREPQSLPQVTAAQGHPVTDDPLAVRLMAYMAEAKPHRDDQLTIAALAGQLGEQEYRLRRLINGQLGHRNFSSFLNSFRLAEVKGALADVTQAQVPILTIALDAGFGSLGPFNRAFREAEGVTPSAFRIRRLVDSGID